MPTTVNDKLSVMEWCNVTEPGLPLSPGVLDQSEKQQLLWGYSGILWPMPPMQLANSKLAHMEWCLPWEPALPATPGGFGQDDRQQLLWGYPRVLWKPGEPPIPVPTRPAVWVIERPEPERRREQDERDIQDLLELLVRRP